MSKHIKQARANHTARVMTDRQAGRMLTGQLESVPGEYRIVTGENERALRDARSRIEDLALARELGVDPADLC